MKKILARSILALLVCLLATMARAAETTGTITWDVAGISLSGQPIVSLKLDYRYDPARWTTPVSGALLLQNSASLLLYGTARANPDGTLFVQANSGAFLNFELTLNAELDGTLDVSDVMAPDNIIRGTLTLDTVE